MAITILNIALNFLVMVYSSVRQLKLYIQLAKAKYARWQANKVKAKESKVINLFEPDPVGHETTKAVTKRKSVKRKNRKEAVSQGVDIEIKQRPLHNLMKEYDKSPLDFNTE